jgi:hypothetical protein
MVVVSHHVLIRVVVFAHEGQLLNIKAGLLEFLDGTLGTCVVIENRNGRVLL